MMLKVTCYDTSHFTDVSIQQTSQQTIAPYSTQIFRLAKRCLIPDTAKEQLVWKGLQYHYSFLRCYLSLQMILRAL